MSDFKTSQTALGNRDTHLSQGFFVFFSCVLCVILSDNEIHLLVALH